MAGRILKWNFSQENVYSQGAPEQILNDTISFS